MDIRTKITQVDQQNRDGSFRQDIISRLRVGDRLYLEDYTSDRFPYAIGVETRDYELCGFLGERAAKEIIDSETALNDAYVTVDAISSDNNGLLSCAISISRETKQHEPSSTEKANKANPIKQKKRKRSKVLSVITFGILGFLALAVVLSMTLGRDIPTQATKTQVVFDAMRFWEDDNLPISEDALIAMLGQPDSTEEWNDVKPDHTYLIKNLYYGNDTYSIYEGRLRSIQLLDVNIPFSSRGEILGMFGLKHNPSTEAFFSGIAYREYDCGVPSFWVQLMTLDTLNTILITYNELFI